jgi:hypothetical protein
VEERKKVNKLGTQRIGGGSLKASLKGMREILALGDTWKCGKIV